MPGAKANQRLLHRVDIGLRLTDSSCRRCFRLSQLASALDCLRQRSAQALHLGGRVSQSVAEIAALLAQLAQGVDRTLLLGDRLQLLRNLPRLVLQLSGFDTGLIQLVGETSDVLQAFAGSTELVIDCFLRFAHNAAMARICFFTALLLLMLGAAQPAGWLMTGAIVCVFAWLLLGPKGRWL